MTSPQDHDLLCDIAAENIAAVVAQSFDDPYQVADAVIYCAAFCVGDMTEAKLREFFTEGGLDLTDYTQFEAAQDVTSAWVACDAIEISDLLHGSLITCDTPLVRKLQIDPELKERIVQAKFEGVLFRDFIMTGDVV